MTESRYAAPSPDPVGGDSGVWRTARRALQVIGDEVSSAARPLHDLAESHRNGEPVTEDAQRLAHAAWRDWAGLHGNLIPRWEAYRSVWPDDGFRPAFQRPSAADLVDAFGLPEIRGEVELWARKVDARLLLLVGSRDGQRVLPAYVSPDGLGVLTWCVHRWNLHENAEGPVSSPCRLCDILDEAPPGPAAYYIVPVNDAVGWGLAVKGYQHPNNSIPAWRYEMPLWRLAEWRKKQAKVAERGRLAPLAESPMLPDRLD